MKAGLVLGGAVALVLGAVGFSYYRFFVVPGKVTERPAPLEPETLRIGALQGKVEVAGPDGAFQPAQPGASLSIRDRIRTDDDATVELRTTDGSTIKLLGGTEARVAELRRELSRLALGAGMLEADVRDDPTRVFEVDLDGQGGVARTRGAAFTASANGAGTAAVASHRGEVILSARGKEVVIRTGQYARLRPGQPPSNPEQIPPSLFLKVDWPAETSRKNRLTVAGQTAPGARVKIDGRFVAVDSEGRYQSDVRLKDGVHTLHVRALDVAGHSVDEKSPRILVDTRTDFKVQPPKWK